MWTIKWAIVVLTLVLGSDVRGEFFQWTDARGVIHFTDNIYSVPEPIRRSPDLIVRTDFEASSDTAAAEESVADESRSQVAEPGKNAEEEAAAPTPVVVSYEPQPVTIIVVNSRVSVPKKKHCPGCKPAIRPDFQNRRYVHPSVFDGGSQQFVHPR